MTQHTCSQEASCIDNTLKLTITHVFNDAIDQLTGGDFMPPYYMMVKTGEGWENF